MGFVVKLNVNSGRNLTVTIIDQAVRGGVERVLLDVILPLDIAPKTKMVSDIDDFNCYDYFYDDDTSVNDNEVVYSSSRYIENIEEQEIYFPYNIENDMVSNDIREYFSDNMDYASDENVVATDYLLSRNDDNVKNKCWFSEREKNNLFNEENCLNVDQNRGEIRRYTQRTDYTPRMKLLRFSSKSEPISKSKYSRLVFKKTKTIDFSIKRNFRSKKLSRILYRM